MPAAHTRRMLAATAVAAVTMGALSACFIPMPPPVPRATSAAPIAPGSTGAGDVREGFIASGGTTVVDLEIDERAAVVLVATSPEGEDLTMRLTGGGVDLENDDNEGEIAGLAFEMGSRDPLVAAVLDAGSYRIELGEFSGDRSSFQLQVLTSTTVVSADAPLVAEILPGEPVVTIAAITDGSESIGATADFDTVLWAHAPLSETHYEDDDSGGSSDPRFSLSGERPQDMVVVAYAYNGAGEGPVTVVVE